MYKPLVNRCTETKFIMCVECEQEVKSTIKERETPGRYASQGTHKIHSVLAWLEWKTKELKRKDTMSTIQEEAV